MDFGGIDVRVSMSREPATANNKSWTLVAMPMLMFPAALNAVDASDCTGAMLAQSAPRTTKVLWSDKRGGVQARRGREEGRRGNMKRVATALPHPHGKMRRLG